MVCEEQLSGTTIMLHSDVKRLQCPLCYGSFKIGTVWQKDGKRIVFGSVVCHCDEFPIVEGILYLFKPLNRQILDSLRQKDFTAALLLSLTQKKKFHPEGVWMKQSKPLLSRILAPHLLQKIGKANCARLLSLYLPKHLVRYYFTRDEWQDSLAIHFPLAALLARPQRRRKILWLDVGSGIVNYFAEMQLAYPQLSIISMDSNFSNLFLSQVFYAGKNVVRICADAHFLRLVQPHSLDVITVIDTLQSLQAPVPVLQQAASSELLKSNGVLFVSGLQEHLFVERDWGIFPAPREMIMHAFKGKKQPIFFDNEELSKQIQAGEIRFQEVRLHKTDPVFSYGFIWTKDQSVPSVLSTQFLSPEVRAKAARRWEDAHKMWQNRAY